MVKLDRNALQDTQKSRVREQDDHAAGMKAVAISMKRSLAEIGPGRTAKTLLRMNRPKASTARVAPWPDPEVGHCPTCSTMCHESTSVALAETIGIGKASVTLEDVHSASLLVLA